MDYKTTVFLPKTDFPMKGGLPDLEPRLLERWAAMDLFGTLRGRSKGRPKFVLHDGPPYANGHLHIGHALNKILKDVINRCQQMRGFDANYVPGWDCHGLPIEWKIEEKYREAGLDKDAVDPIAFRQECRQFAQHWIDVQRDEFKRLGVEGDWQTPYTTMAFRAEAAISRELGKFVVNGSLYKGAKPVLWSVVEKTALAEAEVEYHDLSSVTIWTRFPLAKVSRPDLEGARVVIWTTTPWTIPGNRAVAYGPDLDYQLIAVDAVAEGSLAVPGERLLLNAQLAPQVLAEAKVTAHRVLAAMSGRDLAGCVARHPLADHPEAGGGYSFPVPLLPGGFVTGDVGTGFVHIAPGHGDDDWHLGMAHGIAVPETVLPDGSYHPAVPIFAGRSVLAQGKDGKYYSPAAKPMLEAMKAVGALLASGKLLHSYPHSWRSKAPLIFRTTPQWFISMETNDLRAKALAAIDACRWVPAQGRNRIRSMVESRPDWCVSRQRAWGVPITVFVRRDSGEVLRDQAVIDRIAAAIEAEGADAWFASPAERFLGPTYRAEDWEKVTDILDVWFDSGCTHSFVLENGPWDLAWPASLYLEGSDQHRGWFHSSLLESCGSRGRAPYDAVLTHGFVLDEEGRKMSKSLGNVVAPQEVVASYGADILRLWVVASDYSEDLRIGPEIIKTQVDAYRRLRNTLRYLLGALNGFSETERLDRAEMPQLEQWILHRLAELDGQLRRTCDDYQFHSLFAELLSFCTVDLSAFYFDIRKDALYCDHPDDTRRRAARTVMDQLFNCLVCWLAPFLCFTAEEAWLCRHQDSAESIHLQLFPELPAGWLDDALAARWEKIRDLRRVITGALEVERAAKRIGSSLQAAPRVYLADAAVLDGLDLAEIAITSAVEIVTGAPPAEAFALADVPGVGVVFAPAAGNRCERCWKVLPEVGSHSSGHSHDGLCGRCADAVDRMAATP
ncbi:MAG TPA: isoleucine--tRNA ligase [Rhodospirillaceae bacterium]|nr:isoleucine--tRNA ligase [Rhodospirillaceae bacterium]